MGKKQHQKDKLYLTTTEWRDFYGGSKRTVRADNATSGTYVRLPFCCCSITFQPFENPCCSPDGSIYEKKSILDFLEKYGRHPITGGILASNELIDLNFHRDANGQFSCPITYRVFNEHSHIVAIRTSGNVYSWDAVDQLNFKCDNFVDLISNVPFKGKADVIKLQDPVNVERLDISKFYHVRYSMKTDDSDPTKPDFYLNNLNSDAVSTLKKLKSEPRQFDPALSKEITNSKPADSQPNRIQACNISTGAMAASLTSTAMNRVTHMTPKSNSVNSLVWSRLKAKSCKAYLSIVTNMGSLNLELFASSTPKTVHNFLILCRQGYYDNCEFFRSIRHFIVQTGDPTNTGTGGESAWANEPKFEDEISNKELKHDKRGVLSMANSGPNTNGSQFFITYRPCNQLNGKHTVFGQLVGGFDVLSKIESIEVDEKDRPKVSVRILRVNVFDDPALRFENEIAAEIKSEDGEIKDRMSSHTAHSRLKRKVVSDSKAVGKYVQGLTSIAGSDRSPPCQEYAEKKKVRIDTISTRKEIDFSKWNL